MNYEVYAYLTLLQYLITFVNPQLINLPHSMKVKTKISRLIKPLYEKDYKPPSLHSKIPLGIFDLVTIDAHMPIIYAYKTPTPSNSALELALRKVLSECREWAGRLYIDEASGHPIIILNDEGVRLAEAYADTTLDAATISTPSPALLSLHLGVEGVNELALIQLTTFTCGSLVIGFSTNHMVADGNFVSQFLVAWGRTCRGLDLDLRPLHDRTIFVPRNPPRITFQHQGIEFRNKNMDQKCTQFEPQRDLSMHKTHFTIEFLSSLKSMASSGPGTGKPYSTFKSLVAHLWRTIAKICSPEYESTYVTIAVDGRGRLNPRVPNEYFGNLVLWALPKAKVKELLTKSLSHAARIIHEAVAKVDDDYFKSFIDFVGHRVGEDDDLVPITEWIDSDTSDLVLHVDSWLRFPFNDLDFGGGKPCMFMPSYHPRKGQIYLVSSVVGDGSVDAYLALSQNEIASFEQICYCLN